MSTRSILFNLIRLMALGTSHLTFAQHGELWSDVTSDLPLAQLRDVAKEIRSYLPAVAHQRGVYEWRGFTVADKAHDARPEATVTLPPPPRCEGSPSRKPSGFRRQNAWLRKQCLDREKEETKRWLASAATVFHDNLPLPAVLRAKQVCTSLYSLVRRVSEYGAETPLIMVLSDGDETCRKGSPTPIAAPSAGQQLLLVILTPEGARDPLEHFEKVRKYWHAVAPWVTVIPSFQIEKTLLSGTGPRAPVAVSPTRKRTENPQFSY